MRQLQVRVLRRRLVLVVAGASLVALAASSSFASAERTDSGTGKEGSSARAGGVGGLRADCSMTTALRVAKPFLWTPLLPKPIGQVLCGPFAGPGSEAMAVTFHAPTCWSPQGWAVYRFADGDWRLAMIRRGVFLAAPLAAAGADIRETTPVFLPRDKTRCNPTGGTHARVWHWDGSNFTAGPWQQVKPPARPPRGMKTGHFKTPSGNIVCFHSPGPRERPVPFVLCGIKTGLNPKPPYTPECRRIGLDHNADRISLGATGRAEPIACSGDAGPFAGERGARVLGYGKTWNGGGVTCRSAFAGLTCRNGSGKGFFLSRARWRRF